MLRGSSNGEAAELERLRHTVRSQRGMLLQQGDEIKRLRRRCKGYDHVLLGLERTNGRLAADLVDAWEFIWRVAGGATTGGGARQQARVHLLKAKTKETDRVVAPK